MSQTGAVEHHHRRGGALHFTRRSIAEYEETWHRNGILHEVALRTQERPRPVQYLPASRNRAPISFGIRDAIMRLRGTERQRSVLPDPQDWSLPNPEALPEPYVRLTRTPRGPTQIDIDMATAMMRTWVLVNDEDLAPLPSLPVRKEGEAPRPPLAQGLCCICMEDSRPCEVVFTGCGHMNTCLECAQRLVACEAPPGHATPCPLCRVKSRPLLVRVC